MKLRIAYAERDAAILVCDEDNNDIAEFYHNEHATVSRSYETALALAKKLCGDDSKTAFDEIKRAALDCKPAEVPAALAHIVRLCIDAAKGA